MHLSFICNQEQINIKIKSLSKTSTSEDGWIDFYIDKVTNENWLLTRYDSEYHGGGLQVLKRLPEPTIDELISIAMTSTDTNDIIGASLELSERERYSDEDFRLKLINRLLQVDFSNLTEFERERLKIIIYERDLYDATNRREIVGKHFAEIQKDADYYKEIAQKANNILKGITM